MDRTEREALLADEVLIVRNSGEIPEIAYQGTLFYLQEDEQGPGLELTTEELGTLQAAAMERYREIVLRDLLPENRDRSIYRGIQRTMYNWQRMMAFCLRVGRECTGFREVVSRHLISFLTCEVAEVSQGKRRSSVNCSADDLEDFCRELGVDMERLPAGWKELCPS